MDRAESNSSFEVNDDGDDIFKPWCNALGSVFRFPLKPVVYLVIEGWRIASEVICS